MAQTPALSPAAQAAYYNPREALQRNMAIAMSNLTPDKYANFNAITNRYPNISKDLVMAMVQQGLNADTPGIGKIVSLDGISQLKNDMLNVDKIKSTVKKDRGIVGSIADAFDNLVYDPFKGITRVGFAVLRSPYDFATTLTRDISAIANREKGAGQQLIKDLMGSVVGESTQLGALVRDVVGGKDGVKTGDGFFITPQSRVGKDQAKAMAAYGKVYGESFTIGRFTAKTLGQGPDTTAYKVMSGIVDASLNIALDPSMWLGAGAATKIITGGKKLKELKKIAEPFSEAGQIAKSQEITREATELAKEANKKIRQLRTRSANALLKKDRELQYLQLIKADTAQKSLQKILQQQEDMLGAFGTDPRAAATLAPGNVAEWFVTNPKVQSGELLAGLDRLIGDFKNSSGFADGFILLDDVPEVGKVSVGAHKLDEYLVTAVGDEPLNLLDLSDDLSRLTPEAKQAEVNRRIMFKDEIDAISKDLRVAPEVRDIFGTLARDAKSESKMLKDFAWALPIGGDTVESLATIIGKVAQTKNTAAMELLKDTILKIWQVDGFTNVRSIYGGVGGVLITNAKKIYANNAEVGNALAEIVNPTNLGPNLAKLTSSMKGLDEEIAAKKAELAKAAQDKADLERRLKDIDIFRQYADQDPDLLRAIVNDPEYQKLQGIIDLNVKVADKDILAEWYRAEAGLTVDFGGELGKDYSKVLKYMLGRRFAEVAEVVARETDPVRVRNFFGKKLDAEMVNELTAATTVDDVYRVFLGYMGNPATDPAVFRSMALRKEALNLSANPMAKLVNPLSLVPIRYAETIERAFNRYFVRSTALNLGDLTGLTNGVEDWVSSAQVKAVLGARVQQEIIDDTVRKLLKSTSEQERGAIIEKMTVRIVDDVAVRLGLDDAARKELATKVRVGGKEKAAVTSYTVGKLAADEVPTIAFAGDEVISLPGAMHEFQLLQSTVFLPDTKEILKAFNKYSLNKVYGTAKASKVLAEEMGDIWRTAQLAFRISYIWRNIAEMQMRQMFSGHASMLSHPMQFIALVMSNSGRTSGIRGMIAKRARYQFDLAGNKFNDLEAEGEFLEAIRGYQVNAFRRGSVSDYRSNRKSEVFKYYKVVESDNAEYFDGLAYTLNRFASDKLNPQIAKLMITGDDVAKRDFVQKLIDEYDQQGNVIKEYVTGAFEKNPGIKAIFLKDPSLETFGKENLSFDKIFTFFFDEGQEHTLAGQMRNVAGFGPKSYAILDIIASEARLPNGAIIAAPWKEPMTTARELAALEKAFKEKLKRNFEPDDVKGSRVLVERESIIGAPQVKEITRMVDWFFDYATKLESKYNFGPEFQMSYWDFVGRYARMLSTDDLKHAQRQAAKTLAPVRTKTGKVFGRKHPTLRIIQSEMKRRMKPGYEHVGGASWQTVHQMAARNAGNYVKELFYDASRQKQWAQASRLLFPFAQAHTNTLYKWSQLAGRNPAPAYRFGKAYNALQQEGSNVIYDVTGMTYDDSQGFFYTEPGSDKKQFKIPFVGSLLGALAGRSIDMKDAMQITAPVQSLNLAFGQVSPIVPGIGPAGQILFTASGRSETFGPVYDIFRDIVTPFGGPDSIEDVVFPAWLRKTALYAFGNDAMVQRGVKDWASYLASTGKYGDNPLANDSARTRLFEDAQIMSKRIGWMTALFQSISPATPANEVLAKIKNPDNKMKFMTLTLLYEHWDKISKANPGDYGAAVRVFAEKYGVNNLMIALGGTTSTVRGTEDAWTFLNNHPDIAAKYARTPGDIVPYFFPGGESSVKYYNWQRQSGARRPLSTTELANEAEAMVYSMMKDQIAEEQIANNYPNFWYVQKIAELDKAFGAKPPESVLTGTAGEKIARVGEALANPAFESSPIYPELSEFYPKYMEFQNLLNKLKVSNYAELSAKGGFATILRNDLVATAERLILQNPAFSRMYYGVFASQLEG